MFMLLSEEEWNHHKSSSSSEMVIFCGTLLTAHLSVRPLTDISIYLQFYYWSLAGIFKVRIIRFRPKQKMTKKANGEKSRKKVFDNLINSNSILMWAHLFQILFDFIFYYFMFYYYKIYSTWKKLKQAKINDQKCFNDLIDLRRRLTLSFFQEILFLQIKCQFRFYSSNVS